MKVRIKFAKQGIMKFIGHLDVMRCFQKALRRAGIDVKFSEGMSPHMIMSFASPLGVGLTSVGEYVDIEVNTPVSTQEGIARLNAVMPEGMEVLDLRRIEEGKAGKAMSLVAAADYTVSFREGTKPQLDWEKELAAFCAQESILVKKETKKGETMQDIRPMIHQLQWEADHLFLRLAAGSAANLKPEAVIERFLEERGLSLPPFALLICRRELYADKGADGAHQFVSLGELGEVI